MCLGLSPVLSLGTGRDGSSFLALDGLGVLPFLERWIEPREGGGLALLGLSQTVSWVLGL